MFFDGFLTITIGEVLSLIVTIVGIWFVVKQLNETRLASQMEGLISIGEQLASIVDLREPLMDEIGLADWDKLSDQEAHDRIFQSEALKRGYKKTKNFYELLAVLVKRKSLDKGIASDYFGDSVAIWWERLEKVTRHESSELKYDVGENWAWLAHEFENFSG